MKLPLLDENDQLGFRKRKRELSKAYRAKAYQAIELLDVQESIATLHRSYTAKLDHNFRWAEDVSGEIKVEATVGKESWNVAVFGAEVGREAMPNIVLKVLPNSKNHWGLSAKSVTLKGYGVFPQVFSALWKAFEAELVHHEVRADLVQLCGYYQYAPKFYVKVFSCDSGSWIDVGLRRVLEGRGVRQILSIDELATAIQIDRARIPEFVGALKTFGFEARNSETNPQIPSDSYLIPYAFPTLTNLSVQLRKAL